MELASYQLGGITTTDDGTIIAEGTQGVATYMLTMFRTAMRLEIRTGMYPNRNVKCSTIIPILVEMRIAHVSAPYTRARKIRAYKDLDAYIVANGGQSRSLD
jgi:hypothetical protein